VAANNAAQEAAGASPLLDLLEPLLLHILASFTDAVAARGLVLRGRGQQPARLVGDQLGEGGGSAREREAPAATMPFGRSRVTGIL
jgi:hypothetical protein